MATANSRPVKRAMVSVWMKGNQDATDFMIAWGQMARAMDDLVDDGGT